MITKKYIIWWAIIFLVGTLTFDIVAESPYINRTTPSPKSVCHVR